MTAREDVFQALFALAGSLSWGAPPSGFAFTSRRVALWDDLGGEQPALCQAEHDEQIEQTTGLPPKLTLNASWLIYQNAGADPTAVPATINNQILDAVQAAFPDPAGDQVQTLGGLVSKCWINGRIFKDPGDLDGQGLIIVPIQILVP